MPVIINGTTGISSSNVAASDTVSTGPAGIKFSDNTTQTSAAVLAVPQVQVFTAPGTFNIPASTTRIKVTVVGGGAGASSGAAGASGETTSFGTYASATGGTPSALGVSPGATLDYKSSTMGVFGSSGYPLSSSFASSGGAGVKIIDAPFPVTSVPVTVGAGGGGGGGAGGAGEAATAAQGINGGAGGPGTNLGAGQVSGAGGGGGGAAGLSAPYQGSGAPGAGPAGQAGNGTYNRLGGGGGGAGGAKSGNAGVGSPGGNGGFQGVVIVEY